LAFLFGVIYIWGINLSLLQVKMSTRDLLIDHQHKSNLILHPVITRLRACTCIGCPAAGRRPGDWSPTPRRWFGHPRWWRRRWCPPRCRWARPTSGGGRWRGSGPTPRRWGAPGGRGRRPVRGWSPGSGSSPARCKDRRRPGSPPETEAKESEVTVEDDESDEASGDRNSKDKKRREAREKNNSKKEDEWRDEGQKSDTDQLKQRVKTDSKDGARKMKRWDEFKLVMEAHKYIFFVLF